jgi:dTMP kinase
MRAGFFILEGCEAVGKTTQLKRLEAALREQGHDIVVTREPGGTVIGERIRAILLDREHAAAIQPFTSSLLFNASRRQWVHEVVRPALDAGKIVLADRSFLSTMVYQSYVEGEDPVFTKEVCLKAMEGTMPDTIFLLDISLKEMKQRLVANAGEKTTRYDVKEEAFHAKVREGYLAQIDLFPGLIEKIDGEVPVEEVSGAILGKILKSVS